MASDYTVSPSHRSFYVKWPRTDCTQKSSRLTRWSPNVMLGREPVSVRLPCFQSRELSESDMWRHSEDLDGTWRKAWLELQALSIWPASDEDSIIFRVYCEGCGRNFGTNIWGSIICRTVVFLLQPWTLGLGLSLSHGFCRRKGWWLFELVLLI